MELLWIVLFVALCVGAGALVIACDRLAPTVAPSAAPVSSNTSNGGR